MANNKTNPLNTITSYCLSVLFCATLLFAGCASSTGNTSNSESVQDTRDFSCSYFYFLWGTHAEYEKHYSEALDSYEKALVCDPSADYIKRKLPVLLIKTGDTDQAINILEKDLQHEPQDTARRALLATVFIQQRDTNSAISQYEAILDYDPENEEILFRLGALLSQTGTYDQAAYYLRKVLKIDPNAYYAQLYLARIADQQDETDKAEYYYLEALALNWSAELSQEIADFYARNHRYDDSIKILRAALENDETDEQARLGIVQALLAQDKEEEAIAELSLAKNYSKSPENLSLILSRLYLKNGENQKAQDNLLAILEVTDNPQARYLLGLIYSDAGKFADALAVLDGIKPQQQEFEDAVFLRTKILHQTGQTDEALRLLEKDLADEKSRLPLFYILAASLYQDKGEPERAIALLEQARLLYPKDERILFEYGIQVERSGRLQDAIAIMQQLIAINPDHAEALNFVGYSWADTDQRLEEALSYINRAMALKPGNGYIQDSLGWAYFKLGKFERARKELLGAVELVPEDPNIQDHLGDVYRALGQVNEARAAYLSALEKYDDEKKKEIVRKKIAALEKL